MDAPSVFSVLLSLTFERYVARFFLSTVIAFLMALLFSLYELIILIFSALLLFWRMGGSASFEMLSRSKDAFSHKQHNK